MSGSPKAHSSRSLVHRLLSFGPKKVVNHKYPSFGDPKKAHAPKHSWNYNMGGDSDSALCRVCRKPKFAVEYKPCV